MHVNIFGVVCAFFCAVYSNLCYAQTYDLSSIDVLTVKAKLVMSTCTLSTNLPNDEINFGTLTPAQISNMPSVSNASALNYIRSNSALGDLAPIYAVQDYAITVDIICPGFYKNVYKDNLYPNQFLMQIQFGDPSDLILGGYGISADGFAFKLQTPSLENSLGIIMYLQHVQKSSNNGLIKPGVPIPLTPVGEVFASRPDGTVQTSFRLSPGLFWMNPLAVSGSTQFRMAIPINFTMN